MSKIIVLDSSYREKMREFTGVRATLHKHFLRFEGSRSSAGKQILLFQHHCLRVYPRGNGRFLVILFQLSFRTKKPFWRVLSKAIVTENFCLDQSGFIFENGRHARFTTGKRHHMNEASPKEKYDRTKQKLEVATIINSSDF